LPILVIRDTRTAGTSIQGASNSESVDADVNFDPAHPGRSRKIDARLRKLSYRTARRERHVSL